MKIHCIDLKDINTDRIADKVLLNFAINEIFNIHLKSSKTQQDINMFKDEFKKDNPGFIVAFLNNDVDSREFTLKSKIIGFFIFYNVLDEMHILDITVSKEMQSKGIGSFILDYAIKKYFKEGIKYFFLEVRVSNIKAMCLYKKFGFKSFMVRKGYYDDNKEDAVCMVKEFDNDGLNLAILLNKPS